MTWILDLETNGLWPEVSKIHCGVLCNVYTDEIKTFIDDRIFEINVQHIGAPAENNFKLSELPNHLDQITHLSCHNGIGFDLKVLKKFLNYEYKGTYIDTLLLSRIINPDLDNAQYEDEDTGMMKGVKNPHSIESWGVRFGVHKPDHEDWSRFSIEMLHRCIEDTKIQVKLYNYLITKVKEFSETNWELVIKMEQRVWELIEEQADYGWQFDLEKAFTLVDELSLTCKQIEDRLVPTLPPRVIQLTKTESGATKAFKADGTIANHAYNYLHNTSYLADLAGDFCKVRFDTFNIRSSQQVKDYLLKKGWKPTEWNFKKDKHNKPLKDEHNRNIKMSPKSPKTTEDWELIAKQLNTPEIALLAEYNRAAHRLSQVKGLIDNVRPDHRIEAQANTCATNTARMTHRIVVNIPKAKEKVYYGKQMRSLFIASPGKVLAGCDAAALEGRCEAHFVLPYDKAAALELLEGDIHSFNAGIFQTDREAAKAGKYAILYGCSASKLAQVLNKPVAFAQQIYDSYWEGNLGLKQLKEVLEEEYNEKGYILAIDGRPLTIRYKHAILNTLLQSTGSIAIKTAIVLQDEALKVAGIEAPLLGVFHDEMQRECSSDVADLVGAIMVRSIEKAGEKLGMNVPLTGEYKVGESWDLTH